MQSFGDVMNSMKDLNLSRSGLYPANTTRSISTTRATVNRNSSSTQINHGVNTPKGIPTNYIKDYTSGYSMMYSPLRNNLMTQKSEEYLSTLDYYLADRKHDRESMVYLSTLERGMIQLGAGELSSAAYNLKKAEDMLTVKENRSYTREFLEKYGSNFISFISGKHNLAEYQGEDFEKVLTLNLSSLSQLLEGKRAAYNITRRSIEYQNRAYETFVARKAQIENELKDQQRNSQKSKFNPLNLFTVTEQIDKYYHRHGAKIAHLPHSYVNPFGYYLAGVIQEIESSADYSLRDNARISYEKAALLSPKNPLLESAISATQKERPTGSRVIHLIAASGFVPDKKVMEFHLQVPSLSGIKNMPVKLPFREPINDKASNIEVYNSKGSLLARTSVISDISALVMRNEIDRLPETKLQIVSTMTKSFVASTSVDTGIAVVSAKMPQLGSLLNNTFSNTSWVDFSGEPDTRSWLSLPDRIHAARITTSPHDTNFRIVLKSADGKVLNHRNINVSSNGDIVLFARSYGSSFEVQSSKKLWSDDN